MDKRFSLDGRVVAVTGGCGLIGRAVIATLAQNGAKAVALDVDSAAAELDAAFETFDATDVDDLPARLTALEDRHGPVDVWVNCAYPRSADWGATLDELSAENWRTNVDLQLNAVCLLSNAVAKRMAERGGGVIINLGSIYGLVGPDFSIYEGTGMTLTAPYAAIKGAIAGYTRYLASYWGERGVRVNAVCPGGVFDGQPAAFVTNYEARTPLRRMATPEDVAGPIAFLASDWASYITGAVIPVDGGWTAI